jgi:hypothetical protein
MRDVLIHDYIGVDLDEVWNVASSRIPELQAALDQYLGGENPETPTRRCVRARTALIPTTRSGREILGGPSDRETRRRWLLSRAS